MNLNVIIIIIFFFNHFLAPAGLELLTPFYFRLVFGFPSVIKIIESPPKLDTEMTD